MSKSRVVAYYRPCEHECFQVTVEAADSYPDGLDEARTQAVRGMDDLITTALRLYGHPATTEPKD